MPLGTPTGEVFDWAGTWQAGPLTQAVVTQSVPVGPAASPVRVAASRPAGRLPAAQANAAQRRCRRRAQQAGQTLQAATL
jgi:hypothetical protein